ncbi:MAG: ATP-binding protein [Promethearchaeota archaeon]|nr:MAG: ATP-binding protein [Candidatus Lokiarchaeota archaeon]
MAIQFFIIHLVSLIINCVFYFYRKKGYSLQKFKYGIFVLFSISVINLICNLSYFLENESEEILKNFNQYSYYILNVNFSIILFGVSLILFALNFFYIKENSIDLTPPSYQEAKGGKIKIGRIVKKDSIKYNFCLSLKDLEKHMFICGSTGTGKSNFMQNFLINFTKNYNIPFFLVEFKGEYHFLQEHIKDLLILWPGENFSINIFNPGKSNPIIHAERIFDILKSGRFLEESADFSPQMEKVLIEILVKVCKKASLQNWMGFEQCCNEYLIKNRNLIPMLKQTLISLKNRIRRFSSGPLKGLFETKKMISIQKIFKQNVILDLSSIIRLGGEKEDAFFFLNLILKYLWDKNLTRGAFNFDGIKHVTIIEDAQYFAPQNLIKKSKLTTYLEDIALLQRGTGECLITLATRPDISKEILANNGIVLTFKNHIEKEIMCELLNIDLEKKYYLSKLEEGQCIIRINSIKEPFLLKIPLIKRKFLTISELEKSNDKILYRLREKEKIMNIKNNNRKIESLVNSKKGKSTRFFNKIKKFKKNTKEFMVLQKLKQNKGQIPLTNQIDKKQIIVDNDRKELIEYLNSIINNTEKNE